MGMKSHTVYKTFNTRKRRELVRVTEDVVRACKDSGIQEGMILVSAMHITAGVFINDDEGGLLGDWERWLENLAPEKPHTQYRHNDSGEDNDGITISS